MSKYIYADIFHSIFGGTHYVNIGVIETLVHPRKIKTKTPTCPLCVLTACGQWPSLDYPLIYMAQNNLNSLRPSDAIWLQILVIIGSGNDLLVRCQAIGQTNNYIARRGKLMWNLIQFLPNICSCINHFDDLSKYMCISKHFRYFFQCLQIQVEETYFFHEANVIFTPRVWTCKQKYSWKLFVFCPFLLLFHLFIHFQTFSYFFQFLLFQLQETYFFQQAITVPWQ